MLSRERLVLEILKILISLTYCWALKLDEQLRFYPANLDAIFQIRKTSGMSAVEEVNWKWRDAVKCTSGVEARNIGR